MADDTKILIPVELWKQMQTALIFADMALSENRFAGTNQNPYGVRDLVGSAALAVERFVEKGK